MRLRHAERSREIDSGSRGRAGSAPTAGAAGRALFWTYDPALPSFRHRLEPVARELEARGWRCEVGRLPKGRHVLRLFARRRELARADLLVLGKINLSPGERPLLVRLARHVLFDFDDAIWLRKPLRPGDPPGRSAFRERKFGASCRAAGLVFAGNAFLAARARAHAARVEIVPTGIDLETYAPSAREPDDGRTAVWIGLPENLPYLELVRPALARLAERGIGVRLRVVSSAFPDWPEVPIERVPWSSEGEAAALASASLGIMPLHDDDWSRGKCAFKLLQYMAAGLPTVASPVGESAEVVRPGATGLWAASDAEWEEAIGRLLASQSERRRLGAAGREALGKSHDRRVIARRAADRVAALVAEGG